MRSLLLLLLAASPAVAQTTSTAPSAAAGATTASPTTGAGAVQLGRPPAPLGTTVTLGDRIDAAAGLNSTRAQGGASMPRALQETGSAYRDGAATGSAAENALETAGRPAGIPLGQPPR